MASVNFSGLSLRDFEYVVAVADLGSFARAAEHCHVAQPSLSVQVGKLETRLGALIFERTTRRLIVTPDGARIVEQMRKVLTETRLLLTLTSGPEKPFGGTLRLSAIATLGPYYFPRILQELRLRYPNLSLILGEGRTGDLTQALLDGELDAVLMSMPTNEPRLSEVSLFREPFLMACPTGHSAVSEREVGWTGLLPSDRLLLEDGHCLRDQAIAACADIATSLRHATSLETLKYMVAAGEGCTLMPSLAASSVDGLSYVPLPVADYSRVIALVWRRSDSREQEFADLGRLLHGFALPGIDPFDHVPSSRGVGQEDTEAGQPQRRTRITANTTMSTACKRSGPFEASEAQ
ncbi:MAG: LysR substrate-binding domain-containing protein [Janthinobacterium lividum]